MPEGDTVWQTARRLHAALAGREITRWELRVPRFATSDARGQRVDEVVSAGKHLLLRTPSLSLHTHLGMDGEWSVMPAGARWRGPAHTVRAVVGVEGTDAVGFQLPVVELLARSAESAAVGHLGPDLLDPGWSAEHADRAVANLARSPERELAAALLDQRNLAGLGNEYVNELLFLRGLPPSATVAEAAARAGGLERVVDLGRRLIAANRDRVPRTTTGDTRRGRNLHVYGREGQPCRRCGARIERTRHGGRRLDAALGDTGYVGASGEPVETRVSFFCPMCQRP